MPINQHFKNDVADLFSKYNIAIITGSISNNSILGFKGGIFCVEGNKIQGSYPDVFPADMKPYLDINKFADELREIFDRHDIGRFEGGYRLYWDDGNKFVIEGVSTS